VKLTNNTGGARGVNLKDGTTVWLEPGETREFDKADVTNAHEDLEEGAAAAKEAAKPAKDADKA
jgi:hypothetical protein